uniref:Arrestin_C domain-containing protein n=1 Tax=Panagrellus redivivus TaxID=6233 RepID=A0A7E4VKH8_PANRE
MGCFAMAASGTSVELARCNLNSHNCINIERNTHTMVKLDRFDIVLNNPEEVYFAGQEISGKVVIQTSEDKKVNEILLELKGRARTYWTKHSGKSRIHCSESTPYFCEQLNTHYTHKFVVTAADGKSREKILPAGLHEVPFSYTLPKTLPSSFEGEFGFVRYTCKATCERPWDFDIVCRKAFTVVGIEDINGDAEALAPASISDSNYNIRFCCQRQGTISAEMQIDRSGYTPGEILSVHCKVNNQSQRAIKVPPILRLKQEVNYKAKTFSGSECARKTSRNVLSIEKNEIPADSQLEWDEKLVLPSLAPRLSKCSTMKLTYILELVIDTKLTLALPIMIGTIPLLSDIVLRVKQDRKGSNGTVPVDANGVETSPLIDNNESSSVVQVTITDESGNIIEDTDQLSAEMENMLSSKKRVRMPSSILSELYPSLPSPYYKECHFGRVNISEDKESIQYGENMFAPKYPFYTD